MGLEGKEKVYGGAVAGEGEVQGVGFGDEGRGGNHGSEDENFDRGPLGRHFCPFQCVMVRLFFLVRRYAV